MMQTAKQKLVALALGIDLALCGCGFPYMSVQISGPAKDWLLKGLVFCNGAIDNFRVEIFECPTLDESIKLSSSSWITISDAIYNLETVGFSCILTSVRTVNCHHVADVKNEALGGFPRKSYGGAVFRVQLSVSIVGAEGDGWRINTEYRTKPVRSWLPE